MVRLVQDRRKSLGLEVSDRIRLFLAGADDLEDLFDLIGREVLAVGVSAGEGPGEAFVLELDDRDDARAWIERAPKA